MVRVRQHFEKHVPGFTCHQDVDGMEYKALELPSIEPMADPKSDFFTMFDQKRNATIIASPSPDGIHR